jgi:hypothetical protein
MKNNGTKTFDWDSRSGTHTLVVEGQVNRLTKKTKTVVLARVHNDPKGGHGDDLTVFRLEGDTLYVTDPHKGQDEDRTTRTPSPRTSSSTPATHSRSRSRTARPATGTTATRSSTPA